MKKYRIGEISILSYGNMPKKDLIGRGEYRVFSGYAYKEKYPLTNCKKGDVIVVARGVGGTGDVKIIKEDSYLTNLSIKIEFNKNYVINDYFYYMFLKENLKYLDSGSAQSQITKTDLSNEEIFLPPLDEQKAIAGVLSSLDDKIDLLRRQNETLETMAETLFRHWFIEEVQDDWEEKPLSYFGKIICGKTPPKKIQRYFGGDIPFIKIPDMRDNIFVFNTTDTLTAEGLISQENKSIPEKSICVSCIATVGIVSMNAKLSQTNQQINSIIPSKEIYRYYLYLTMKKLNSYLHALASGGTATLNLNTSDFSRIGISFPGDEKLIDFHNIVNCLFEKIFINQEQIITLTQFRDILLPKLMSGEVRVV